MVRFEKNKIVIEIESKFPEYEWEDMVKSLVRCIGAMDPELNNGDILGGVCSLIENMIPDEQWLKKKLDEK